jgi:hypothetical protein
MYWSSQPELESLKVFRCAKCKKTFREGKGKMGCLVNHHPSACCHFGDQEIAEEKFNSILKAAE